jgi:hypothetical protein
MEKEYVIVIVSEDERGYVVEKKDAVRYVELTDKAFSLANAGDERYDEVLDELGELQVADFPYDNESGAAGDYGYVLPISFTGFKIEED